MPQRANKVVETKEIRNINICCIQETRWRGGSARTISENGFKCWFFHSGDKTGYGGVGVLIKDKLIDHVLLVEKVNNYEYIHPTWKSDNNIKSVYAPQSGRLTIEKDASQSGWSAIEQNESFTKFMGKIIKVSDLEILVVVGDLNGHISNCTDAFKNIHGGKAYCHQNFDDTRTLDINTTTNLAITNTYFSKPVSRLLGTSLSQINFILIK